MEADRRSPESIEADRPRKVENTLNEHSIDIFPA